MTGLELLLILIILYFGLRVNRIEQRMNQMEPSETAAIGKPFECGTLQENFQRVAKDFKDAKKDGKAKAEALAAEKAEKEA